MEQNNSREQEKGQMPDARRGRALWKAAAVLVVIVAAGAVIAVKQAKNGSSQPGQTEDMGTNKVSPADTSAQGPEHSAQSDETAGQRDGGGGRKTFSPETVLATVNGTEITLTELEKALQAMPERNRASFKNRRHAFLEEVISKKLLLQEARSESEAMNAGKQPDNNGEEQHSAASEDQVINTFLQEKVLNGLEATEADIQSFYEEHKDQMPSGQSYDELKQSLRHAALQEKQMTAVDNYLNKLQDNASVTRNEEWIEAQKASAADNPLDNALAKDVPVLADFGRGQCRPCEMMKPILKKMKKDYEGKAEVLVIDVGEYPGIARRVGVRAIPTQIFYDVEGNEVSRHQGFMSREKMDERLEEMGVE